MAESDVDLIRRALDASDAFFRARDEMNSVIHLAEVRWSPITELVGKARAAVYAGLAEMAHGDPTNAGHDFVTPPAEGSDDG